MPLLVKVRSFLRNFFFSRRVETDLDQEVQSHLEMLIEENIRAGMPLKEAQRGARIELGGIEQVKEQVREQRIGNWLHSVLSDCRFALRQLRKSPAFTTVAILTLALGIGANTAIFSVVNGVLIRPLPYPESDRLVELMRGQNSGNDETVEASKFLFWRQQGRVFEAMAAFDIFGTGFNLASGGQPEHVTGMRVSADFFRVLGVRPAIGRDFTAEEGAPGGVNVSVISNNLWKQQFGGDTSITGKSISLNGEAYTVVGVMPGGFESRPSADVWVPLRPVFNPQNDGGPLFIVLGRLKPGATLKAAQSDMKRVGEHFRTDFPDFMGKDETVTVVDYQEHMVGDVRRALLILLGAVGFVLLVACANVANLLLSRATGRSKEMAVRVALGAGRSRLVRQLLTESTMLALVGSGLGLLFSKCCLLGLLQMAPGSLPQFSTTHIDQHVLGFTLGLAFLTAVVFGLAPTLQMSGTELNDSLQEGGGRTAGSVHHTRLRDVLVVMEISVSLALLVGATLLIRTYANLREINPGVDPRNVLTVKLSLSGSKFETTSATWEFLRKVVDRTESLPAVDAAAFVTVLPLEKGPDQPFQIEGLRDSEYRDAQFRAITPDYFHAVGAPLLQGRYFTQADNAQSPGVVIINEVLARQYFRGRSPIGEHLTITGGAVTGTVAIIGVAGAIHEDGLDNPPPPTLFVPAAQLVDPFTRLMNKVVAASFVVRAKAAPMSIVADVQKELLAYDATVAAFNFRSMESVLAGSIVRQRLNMLLLGTFAAMALMLSAVGLYGVISYAVTLRAREVGIRMALGADQSDVLGLIVKQGMRVIVIGVAVGVGLALLSTRLISSMIYGVRPTDPATLGSASLGLVVVAFLATYIPARRATKVDPMVALRYE
jgi:putative ABC transport system permease protein